MLILEKSIIIYIDGLSTKRIIYFRNYYSQMTSKYYERTNVALHLLYINICATTNDFLFLSFNAFAYR